MSLTWDLQTLDADLEEFRRRLRVRVRRAVHENLGDSAGAGAFRIIEALVQRGPLSPSDLAALLEVRTSTMTNHLDRLEELGWAQRQAAALGPSRLHVCATEAGREAFARYVAVRRQVLREVLEPLGPAEVAQLAWALHCCVQERSNGEAR